MKAWVSMMALCIAGADILPTGMTAIAADKSVVSATAPADPGSTPADEATWLPIEHIVPADVHKAFVPCYTGEATKLLPEPLRDELERSVFHDLHFGMQPDAESCRYALNASIVFWGGKPLPADYTIRKAQMEQTMRRLTEGPFRRVGFPDRPLQVRRARFDQTFPELTAMLPPAQKAMASREVLVVAVQCIVMVTPEQAGGRLYRPYDLRLVCDPQAPTPVFHVVQSMYRNPLTDPVTELPLLLRGQDGDAGQGK